MISKLEREGRLISEELTRLRAIGVRSPGVLIERFGVGACRRARGRLAAYCARGRVVESPAGFLVAVLVRDQVEGAVGELGDRRRFGFRWWGWW